MKADQQRKSRFRQLRLESLEHRSLLAGDVTAGLTYHYKFDDTGDFATDSAGTNTASLGNFQAGEPKWVDGRFGGGLRFDGADDFVVTSETVSLPQYTASFWLNVVNVGHNPRIIGIEGTTGQIIWDTDRGFGISVFTGSTFVSDPVRPQTGKWTHYVVEVDSLNSTATVYRDGNKTATGNIVTNSVPKLWVFGHNPVLANHGDSLDGILDDLRIYDRLLTPEEIVALHEFGIPSVSLGSSSTYTENGPGVAIASTATVSDDNSANFNGGTLSVNVTPTTRSTSDALFIQSVGTGAGEISVSGDSTLWHVQYEGTEIGTFSGLAGPSLNIALNYNATQEATQALLRQVHFRVDGEMPVTNQREIEVQLNDGSPVSSDVARVFVNVVASNDIPTLGAIGGTVAFVENAPDTYLAPNATVTDVDNTNFAGGTLTVNIASGASADDEVFVRGQSQGAAPIQLQGDASGYIIIFNNKVIGTFSGLPGPSLSIALTSNATPLATQALLRAISFRVRGDTPATHDRQIDFTLSDGSGGTSATATTIVTVTATNDPPVLLELGTAEGYVEQGSGIAIAPLAVVSDPDSTNFAGGTLGVSVSAGTQSAADRLFIQPTGNGAGQVSLTGNAALMHVFVGGVEIGTVTGSEGPTLSVLLNSNATPAATQILVRQIFFRVDGGSPSAQPRQIDFSLSDGVSSLATGKLVAAYTFDGTTNDASGNGHDGVLSGSGTSYTDGRFGQSLNFTGSQQVNVPYSSNFALSTFTVLAWVNLSSKPGVRYGILGTRFNADFAFDLKVEPTLIHSDLADGTTFISSNLDIGASDTGSNGAGGDLPLGSWHQLAYVVDNAQQQVRMFIDGDLKRSYSYSGTPLFMKAGQILAIGNSYGLEYMTGKIDDVAIFNSALSNAEVDYLSQHPALAAATSITIGVTPLNSDPVIGGVGGTVNYIENEPAVQVAANATLTDSDNANFAGGSLIAAVTANTLSADDRLLVVSTGTGSGQINVTGNATLWHVTYEGTEIGTFVGNPGPSLVIALNTNATPAAVQALMRQVSFRVDGDTPATNSRELYFHVDDGLGGMTSSQPITVTVVAVNDAPVVGGVGGTVNYVEDEAAVSIAANATLTDADNTSFAGGLLIAAVTANTRSADDQLLLVSTGTGTGQIDVTGDASLWHVTYEGTEIGTFVGNPGPSLVVALNANATPAAVQALMRQVFFRVDGDNPATNPRELYIRVDDGLGGMSSIQPITATVVAVNDDPVLKNVGGAASYKLNSAKPIALAGRAIVQDADSADFAGGKLTVMAVRGADAGNMLSLAGPFSIKGRKVLLGSDLIGILNLRGGRGLTKFEITFNANATPVVVQQLVRAIRFQTVNSQSKKLRVFALVVTDGDGGTSLTLRKSVKIR